MEVATLAAILVSLMDTGSDYILLLAGPANDYILPLTENN